MSRQVQRAHDIQGYLLQSAAWRETSLLIQIFTRDNGVLALVAKGAKRPYSALRPVLMAFQPLRLSWSGAGEVKTLSRAEAEQVRPLRGRVLMSAWYMNELILRMLAREDAHAVLYDAYDAALCRLADGVSAAGALRRFEWVLLEETGYGLDQPMPDFDDMAAEPALRRSLRERINEVLAGRPLQTRKVLMELAHYS